MYVREIPFFIKRYEEPINLLKGVLFQSTMLHNSWQAEPTLVKHCWERKAFRILGLGERKGRWGMEQDFHWDFQVNVTWFFASFSGVLDWIVLILVWFERSLHSAQISGQSCPWPLKLMTSQRVERKWIRTGGYRQFRGEWVNNIYVAASFSFTSYTVAQNDI